MVGKHYIHNSISHPNYDDMHVWQLRVEIKLHSRFLLLKKSLKGRKFYCKALVMTKVNFD